jgi:hypothetical protein
MYTVDALVHNMNIVTKLLKCALAKQRLEPSDTYPFFETKFKICLVHVALAKTSLQRPHLGYLPPVGTGN